MKLSGALVSISPAWFAAIREWDFPEKGRRRYIINVAAAVIIVGYLLLLTPSSGYFLKDPDGGVFLLGGSHIVKVDEHPGRDFFANYGPLSYHLRAFAFRLFGERIISEVILVVLAYGVSYFMLLRLTLPYTKSYILSSVIVFFALSCIPRYYKFFVVLVPLATIWACLWFIRFSGNLSAIIMGVIAGAAALFRQDYGVVAFVIAILAIIIGGGHSNRRKSFQALICTSGAFLTYLPWLLFASRSIGPVKYVQNMVNATASQGSGLSTPHPILYWDWPEAGLFAFFYAIPVLAVCLLAVKWKAINRSVRTAVLIVVSMAMFTLIQSMHRADYSHLLQSIAPVFLLVPLLFYMRVRQYFMVLIAMLLLLGMFWSFWTIRGWKLTLRPQRPIVVLNALADAVDTKQEHLQHMRRKKRHNYLTAAVLTLNYCAKKSERVNVFPFSPQIPFFADRLSGGGVLAIPGFNPPPHFQEMAVARMKATPPAVILCDENFLFDENPQRSPIQHNAMIQQFIINHYDLVKNIKGWTVYAHQSLPPERISQCAQYIEGLAK